MSGSEQVAFIITDEVTPGVTPAAATWDTLPASSDSLTGSPTTQVLDVSGPDGQTLGEVKTGEEIGGDIVSIFQASVWDKIMESVMQSTFTGDVLQIGSIPKSFTIEKQFNDVVGENKLAYKGMFGSGFNIASAFDQPVNFTSSFTGLGKTRETASLSTGGTVNPSFSHTDRPFMSTALHFVRASFEIDSVTNNMCIQSYNIGVTNQFEAKRCAGSQGVAGINWFEKAVAGQIVADLDPDAWLLLSNKDSLTPISVQLELNDGTRSYVFLIPVGVVSGADPAKGGRNQSVPVTFDLTGHYDATSTALQITRVP